MFFLLRGKLPKNSMNPVLVLLWSFRTFCGPKVFPPPVKYFDILPQTGSTIFEYLDPPTLTHAHTVTHTCLFLCCRRRRRRRGRRASCSWIQKFRPWWRWPGKLCTARDSGSPKTTSSRKQRDSESLEKLRYQPLSVSLFNQKLNLFRATVLSDKDPNDLTNPITDPGTTSKA